MQKNEEREGPVQGRLYRSTKLWLFYCDLEESLGTLESTRAVYDKILELRIATPQVILNYALFLQVSSLTIVSESPGSLLGSALSLVPPNAIKGFPVQLYISQCSKVEDLHMPLNLSVIIHSFPLTCWSTNMLSKKVCFFQVMLVNCRNSVS